MGSRVEIFAEFSSSGEGFAGTLDFPGQKARGVPLSGLRVEGGRIHFELPAGPDLGVFNGEVKDREIAGTFTQAGVTGSFRLTREEVSGKKTPVGAPLPYTEEEVRFEVEGATLAGTLTLPHGGPQPAVVLLSGSGRHDRDQEVAGFKMFRVIADRLARDGLAVLRWDDRGVGASTGGSLWNYTLENAATDALAGVCFLQRHPAIIAARVGLCGYSEGALVAAQAATRSPHAPYPRALTAQEELSQRHAGRSEEELGQALGLRKRVLDLAAEGKVSGLCVALREEVQHEIQRLPQDKRAAVTDPEHMAASIVEQRLRLLLSPWFRYLFAYNPRIHLSQLAVPVLALFGGRDLQVPVASNEAALVAAIRSGGLRDLTVRTFPEANHLFLPARTGAISEYGTLGHEFVKSFLETLRNYLKTPKLPYHCCQLT
jgi:uncharacterized protein